MNRTLAALDRRMEQLGRLQLLAVSACGVVFIGGIDYATGYEISMSLFYLAPVAIGAWYGGRAPGVTTASLASVTWFLADIGGGDHYSHPAIPVWNALVRLGIFLITASLLTALRASLVKQRHLARTDGLTGLFSRRAFEERLSHDLALARRHGLPLTLVYVDVDDFKAVNDTRGHAEGDRVLRLLGELLRGAVREADTPGRLGGDEFTLLLPDTDGEGARAVVSKLRAELQRSLRSGSTEVTCSIGAVTIHDPKVSAEAALDAADELMYESKRRSKGEAAFSVIGAGTPQGAG